MPLQPDQMLSHYRVVEKIGEGGMGEVYRALDTRLDREVAVKVLPEHLSSSPEARQRFEREARSASSLNHPNICTVHDIGSSHEGVDYLVMELLEGETLAQRLERGPLPLDQILEIAVSIADALDRAHRQGLVHRDLKPGNVMLARGGAKLLDFGLAKLTAASPEVSSLTAVPTAASPLTAQGTIVGTFQYMAPEQLEGKEADARADIFAFGAMLHEMATGRRAFEGKTQAGVMAAILERDPEPLSDVRPGMPPALERLVRTCVEKDPDERRQSMHDVVLELKWIAEGGGAETTSAGAPVQRPGRERMWMGAAAALLAVTLVLVWLVASGTGVAPETRFHMTILAPEGTTFVPSGVPESSAKVSPDGTMLTFASEDADGVRNLWVRRLDSFEPRMLPGTEGAYRPFWSPDSRSLGFFAGGKLRRVDVAGGPALPLADVGSGRGGTWSESGTIVFGPQAIGPLFQVAETGGDVAPVTEMEAGSREETHRHPWFLPDGRRFLYLVRIPAGPGEERQTIVAAGSVDSMERTEILRASSQAIYASGHLLYLHDRVLMALPFDPDRLEVTGTAVPLVEGVLFDNNFSHGALSASRNGVLAYHTGSVDLGGRLAWHDRAGLAEEPLAPGAQYTDIRLSPDGGRAALSIYDANVASSDIWVVHLERDLLTRLTSTPDLDTAPVWSPDGRRIVYSASMGATEPGIYIRDADGTGEPERLLGAPVGKNFVGSARPQSWAPDGSVLLYNSRREPDAPDWDLSLLPLDGDRTPRPFLDSTFRESSARFSPDGRWVAYTSNESGRREVYVTGYPGPRGRWQVSSDGGGGPRWRADGTELFFQTPDRRQMVAHVDGRGEEFRIDGVELLFPLTIWEFTRNTYDVAADGSRFLMLRPVDQETPHPVSVITRWPALLRD